MPIVLDGTTIEARQSLLDAIEVAWHRLARPGTWWSGEERLALARETRLAHDCNLCRQR